MVAYTVTASDGWQNPAVIAQIDPWVTVAKHERAGTDG